MRRFLLLLLLAVISAACAREAPPVPTPSPTPGPLSRARDLVAQASARRTITEVAFLVAEGRSEAVPQIQLAGLTLTDKRSRGPSEVALQFDPSVQAIAAVRSEAGRCFAVRRSWDPGRIDYAIARPTSCLPSAFKPADFSGTGWVQAAADERERAAALAAVLVDRPPPGFVLTTDDYEAFDADPPEATPAPKDVANSSLMHGLEGAGSLFAGFTEANRVNKFGIDGGYVRRWQRGRDVLGDWITVMALSFETPEASQRYLGPQATPRPATIRPLTVKGVPGATGFLHTSGVGDQAVVQATVQFSAGARVFIITTQASDDAAASRLASDAARQQHGRG